MGRNDIEALAVEGEFLPEPGSGFGILVQSRKEYKGVMKPRPRAEDINEEFKRLLKERKMSEAILLLRDALVKFPNNPKVKLYLAECYFYTRETRLAVELCKEIDCSLIKRSRHCAAISGYLLRNGNPALAMPYAKRAIELSPEEGDLHHDLAYLYVENSDHKSAIEAYAKAAKLGVSNLTLLKERLGELLVFRGYTETGKKGDEFFDSVIKEYISG